MGNLLGENKDFSESGVPAFSKNTKSLSIEQYKVLQEEDRRYQEIMINIRNEAYLRKLKDLETKE